ncbi:ATP-dependent (S)-NAD(P)H-hydrate dehydratase-like isoform X3 [Mytilus galloprovincialis]|uniref:ATP-dependent (S)-NAD(P)H-hydrate dehydratase n=2 Tax=Mytilus TaxID=6548 RepID=A0A8S3RT37_MYTED|nr:CARKD [Mytilus edulis]
MLSVASLLGSLLSRSSGGPTAKIGSFQWVHTSYNKPGLLLEMVQSVIPPITFISHKGLAGRIAVIGGSKEYTGAPYFAAISALKVGADLSHVFCTEGASTVIKSYSPELIVHPILESKFAVHETSEWLERMHAVVLGPGLGRDPVVCLDTAKNILEEVKKKNLPLVVDADGLFLVTEYPDLIKSYGKAILTPNIVEFGRLYEKMMGEKPKPEEPVLAVKVLSRALGNVTIVKKGPNDIISDGENVLVCCSEGSPRRCGGQGDLLSGAMGTFSYWAHQAIERGTDNALLSLYGPNLCAAYAACLLTKECNKQAYSQKRRSTTTSDMIDCIQSSFEALFE